MVVNAAELLLLLLPLASAATYETDEHGISVLTQANFDAWLRDHPVSLVHFYTPWCAKCKDFALDWERLAAKVKTLPNPVPLAKCDATEFGDVADRFSVYGYPSIHTFYGGGENEEYEGKRDLEPLLQHITNVAQYKAPVQVSSAAALEALAASAQTSVVLGLFRQPLSASAGFKTFKHTVWELARSGHAISAAYSASYATPPVHPLTEDGKKPPVPSVVQLDGAGALATKVMPLPRKKEDFTKEAIAEWLRSAGMLAHLVEKPNDYPEKDYNDPDETPDDDYPEDYDHDHDD